MEFTFSVQSQVILTGAKGFIGRSLSRYIQARGGEVLAYDAEDGYDVCDEKQLKNFMLLHSKCINLVHLAGLDEKIIGRKSVSSLSRERFMKTLEVNIYGTWLVNSIFAETRDQGVVVNASSIYSQKNAILELYESKYGKSPAYTSSKAAQNRLNTQLSSIYGPRFRFNSLVIGAIVQDQSTDFINQYSKVTNLKRMMSVDEILGPCMFLLSEAASYIAGQELIVDGGYKL